MARPWKRAVSILALLALIGGGWAYARRSPASEGSAERLAYGPRAATDGPPGKFWKVPPFAFPSQRGTEVSLESLRGRPWIVDFIFTQCTNACPIMTSRMVLLQRALADVDVSFVSFSVDPAHDSPAALAAYATTWNASEARWSLLATSANRLPDVLAGFRVTAKGTNDERDPIMHSSVFLLVDDDGWVRGAYDSNDEGARARLSADVRSIAKPIEAPTVADARLYSTLGCAGCHDNARVAPPLTNLLGSERLLANGMKLQVDEAYLRRAIVEPGTELVAGYPPIMPTYATQLTPPQIEQLIHELLDRHSADAAAPAQDVALATDPVCHMTVRAAPESLHVTARGHEVYFCSESCRDRFVANPDKFELAH